MVTCIGLRGELYKAKEYLEEFRTVFEIARETRDKKVLGNRLLYAKSQLNLVWGFLYPTIHDLRQLDGWQDLNPKDFWKKFKDEGFELSLKNRRVIYEHSVILADKNLSTGYVLDGIIVKGNLKVTAISKTDRLPSNIVVAGDCEIEGSNLDVLPFAFRVWGNLHIGWRVRYLPDDLQVGGDIHIPGYLEEQAKKLKEAGNIKGEVYIK